MKNAVQCGNVITAAAPYAVTSGDGALIGSLFGVAAATYANAAEGEFELEGVFKITALSTDTFAVGAKVYWDDTNKRCTSTSASNTLIGAATVAKASGATTVTVRLDGIAH